METTLQMSFAQSLKATHDRRQKSVCSPSEWTTRTTDRRDSGLHRYRDELPNCRQMQRSDHKPSRPPQETDRPVPLSHSAIDCNVLQSIAKWTDTITSSPNRIDRIQSSGRKATWSAYLNGFWPWQTITAKNARPSISAAAMIIAT